MRPAEPLYPVNKTLPDSLTFEVPKGISSDTAINQFFLVNSFFGVAEQARFLQLVDYFEIKKAKLVLKNGVYVFDQLISEFIVHNSRDATLGLCNLLWTVSPEEANAFFHENVNRLLLDEKLSVDQLLKNKRRLIRLNLLHDNIYYQEYNSGRFNDELMFDSPDIAYSNFSNKVALNFILLRRLSPVQLLKMSFSLWPFLDHRQYSDLLDINFVDQLLHLTDAERDKLLKIRYIENKDVILCLRQNKMTLRELVNLDVPEGGFTSRQQVDAAVNTQRQAFEDQLRSNKWLEQLLQNLDVKPQLYLMTVEELNQSKFGNSHVISLILDLGMTCREASEIPFADDDDQYKVMRKLRLYRKFSDHLFLHQFVTIPSLMSRLLVLPENDYDAVYNSPVYGNRQVREQLLGGEITFKQAINMKIVMVPQPDRDKPKQNQPIDDGKCISM